MKKTFIISLLLLLLSAGCQPGGGITFSPEQAGVEAATRMLQDRADIDPQSVVVRQTVNFDGKTFVMVSFERLIDGRREKCTSMNEVRKSPLGAWTSGSGGGGCYGQVLINGQPETEPEPEVGMEVGGGSSGGSTPLDPGYSHVNGIVKQQDIASVRVTWSDGTTTEAPVINGSYLIIRAGSVQYQNVEGLNEDGEVVFGSEVNIAPGKLP